VPAEASADALALARLARGEIGALGEIYERHHAAVHRFVSRVAIGDDIDDIVHNTFLAVPNAAHGYDGRASCRSWLMGIAARKLQHRNRSLARLGRALVRFASELSTRPAQVRGPEQAAVLGDEVAALELALSKITEAKRVVLLMAEVEGLSCDEIAAALGIPVGTVWTRLHHARNDIRAIMSRRGVTP
jgi:RNA polymerase sigma-70 factor, ECF subfamily